MTRPERTNSKKQWQTPWNKKNQGEPTNINLENIVLKDKIDRTLKQTRELASLGHKLPVKSAQKKQIQQKSYDMALTLLSQVKENVNSNTAYFEDKGVGLTAYLSELEKTQDFALIFGVLQEHSAFLAELLKRA